MKTPNPGSAVLAGVVGTLAMTVLLYTAPLSTAPLMGPGFQPR